MGKGFELTGKPVKHNDIIFSSIKCIPIALYTSQKGKVKDFHARGKGVVHLKGAVHLYGYGQEWLPEIEGRSHRDGRCAMN